MTSRARQIWLPPIFILLSAILISQLTRPGQLPWTSKMPLSYPTYVPPPNMQAKTWTMKYDADMIPIFTFEDLSIPIYPIFDKAGARLRYLTKDEAQLYSTMTWEQREIYHTAVQYPEITQEDIDETERQIREFVELREKLAPVIAEAEAAEKVAKTPKEEYEETLKRYDEDPILLSDRRTKKTVADRIMMGEAFLNEDSIIVTVTDAEKQAYNLMSPKEKEKWLKNNEVQDLTERFKEYAKETYERQLKEADEPPRKADFVKDVENAVKCGFMGCKGETDGTTGFLGYRTWYDDEKAWEEYKVKAREAIVKSWQYDADQGGDPDNVLQKFQVTWIEDKELKGASIEDVRKLAHAKLPKIGTSHKMGFFNSNIYPFGVLYADQAAINSVLLPSEPRSGMPGHKSEPPQQNYYIGNSKVTGVPYIWFIDHMYGSSESDAEDYFGDDDYMGHWKVAMEAVTELWMMTTVMLRPVQQFWPGAKEDDILSSLK